MSFGQEQSGDNIDQRRRVTLGKQTTMQEVGTLLHTMCTLAYYWWASAAAQFNHHSILRTTLSMTGCGQWGLVSVERMSDNR